MIVDLDICHERKQQCRRQEAGTTMSDLSGKAAVVTGGAAGIGHLAPARKRSVVAISSPFHGAIMCMANSNIRSTHAQRHYTSDFSCGRSAGRN
jgi:hypothetical protein